jgi:leader peptidase (prepilin peptidase) / N-methyltransferase
MLVALTLLCAGLGALSGPFLAVAMERVPERRPLRPVGPFPKRAPLVAAVTAAAFAGAAWRFGTSWALPAFLAFLAGLLVLAVTDAEHFLLPNRIVYPTGVATGVLLVLAAAAEHQWHRLVVALICAAVTFAFFFVVNFANPRWLAFGDVRLSFIIGLALGWLGPAQLLLGLFVANALAAVVGIALMVAGRMKRGGHLPLGVFLALGAAVTVYAGHALVHR